MKKIEWLCKNCGHSTIAASRNVVETKLLEGIDREDLPIYGGKIMREEDSVRVSFKCANCRDEILVGWDHEIVDYLKEWEANNLRHGDVVLADGVRLEWDNKLKSFKYAGMASESRTYYEGKEVAIDGVGRITAITNDGEDPDV